MDRQNNSQTVHGRSWVDAGKEQKGEAKQSKKTEGNEFLLKVKT